MRPRDLATRASWPPELDRYKAPGTVDYIAQVVSGAAQCRTCWQRLTDEDQLSVSVIVREAPDAEQISAGVRYRQFESLVSHASCAAPALRVETEEGFAQPDETVAWGTYSISALGTRYGDGDGDVVLWWPTLVFRSGLSVTIGEEGGDATSINVMGLLEAGFELIQNPDLGQILLADPPIVRTGGATLTRAGDLEVHVGGRKVLWDVRIDPNGDETDRAWTEACWGRGSLLVVTGEGFRVEANGDFDLRAGMDQASVVAAWLPVTLIPKRWE